MTKDEKDACYQILSFELWWTFVIYKKNCYWPKLSYLNFEEPYIPPLKEELHVEENTVFEDYVEVKEQNIEIFEEINEEVLLENKILKSRLLWRKIMNVLL